MALDPATAAAFAEDGWARVENAIDQEVVDTLKDEITALCRGERGLVAGWSPPPADATDDEALRRYVAVHFPHKRSEPIRALAHDPRLVALWTGLLGPDIKCVQTMAFIRPPGGPGQAWHQDEHFIPSRDASVRGIWLALDDATIDNGCLWVVPGSHRHRRLWRHAPHADPDCDPVPRAEPPPGTLAGAIPVPAKSGDLIVFDGYLLHRSGPNRTDGPRRAIGLHGVRAATRMPWMGAEQRGPIGGADCRDFELVAGEDPYRDEPKAALLLPWMRPAKLP